MIKIRHSQYKRIDAWDFLGISLLMEKSELEKPRSG
jgi:hypothetical protein